MSTSDWVYVGIYSGFLVAGSIYCGIWLARKMRRVSESYDNFWRHFGRMWAGNDR